MEPGRSASPGKGERLANFRNMAAQRSAGEQLFCAAGFFRLMAARQSQRDIVQLGCELLADDRRLCLQHHIQSALGSGNECYGEGKLTIRIRNNATGSVSTTAISLVAEAVGFA